MSDSSIEAQFAPDIDTRWAGEFILEARLLEIPGHRIGDSLSEVNSHCRDADEDAAKAFGDPAEYARVIAAQTSTAPTRWVSLMGPVLLQIVGVVLALQGVGGLVTGIVHPLTWSGLAMLVGLAGGVLLLAFALSRSLGIIVRRPLIGAVLVGVAGALLFAGPYLLLTIESPPLPVTAGIILACGITFMVVGIGLDIRKGRKTDDPISAPGIAPRRSRMKYLTAGTSIAWLLLGATTIILFAPR
ncbi:hypothetical protein [Arthrobacter flavus]|uniref:Uncharacterized protein n=1 Tax=Arthrobacter flavus TaxID=95172 RepID=A0ABW4Q830_9MICC